MGPLVGFVAEKNAQAHYPEYLNPIPEYFRALFNLLAFSFWGACMKGKVKQMCQMIKGNRTLIEMIFIIHYDCTIT